MRDQTNIRNDVIHPGMVAQLALLVVIVNIAACLIANRAMTLAAQASMAAAQTAARPFSAAKEDIETARSPQLTLAPMINHPRNPARSSAALNP